jgi:hypothetical protein
MIAVTLGQHVESIDMRQLNPDELETVSGGNGVVVGLIVAVATWALSHYELDTNAVDTVLKPIPWPPRPA